MYYLFRVELTLSKVEDQVWPQVVVGDNRGEMTMDPAVVAQIHERLAALTSDQMVRARVLSVVLQYHTLLIYYFFQSILHILRHTLVLLISVDKRFFMIPVVHVLASYCCVPTLQYMQFHLLCMLMGIYKCFIFYVHVPYCTCRFTIDIESRSG